MDLSVNAKTAYVSPNDSRRIEVELSDVGEGDILNHFSPEQVADHFDHEDLLKHIDVVTVKKYFDLIDA